MAKYFASVCFLLVAFNAVLSDTDNQNSVLQPEERLDPVQQVQLSNDDVEGGDREKRLGIIKKIGLKAGLLDFVFGKINAVIDAKTRAVNQLDRQNIYKNEKYFGITYPPSAPQNNLRVPGYRRPSTSSTPAPVNFEVNAPVSLSIPDRLYGNSFTLITNASKIFGDVIYNTADRAQEFADRVNSKLKNKFIIARKFIQFKEPVLHIGKNYGSSS